jgi:antirestriction protein ArdC
MATVRPKNPTLITQAEFHATRREMASRLCAAIEARRITSFSQLVWPTSARDRGRGIGSWDESRLPLSIADRRVVQTQAGMWLLMLEAAERGYASRLWGTSSQWAARRATVRSDEADRGIEVAWCYARQVDKEDDWDFEENGRYYKFSYHRATYFNLDQVEGPGLERFRRPGDPLGGAFERIDELFAACRPDVIHERPEGSPVRRPAYNATEDIIELPRWGGLKYQNARLHELCHWAMAEGRTGQGHYFCLGRDHEEWPRLYAMGELTAETAAIFLAHDLGVRYVDMREHEDYLASQLPALDHDVTYVWTAAQKGSQVADYLLAILAGEIKPKPSRQMNSRRAMRAWTTRRMNSD